MGFLNGKTMKSINEYILSQHDNSNGRQNIEWANLWYSNAKNVPPQDHILMIGDSTARMVRSTFEKLSGKPVDMIGSSYGLNDVLFSSLVDAFFSTTQYLYSHIYLQMGRHSIINKNDEPYGTPDYEQFRKDYTTLVEFLKQHSSNVILLTCFFDVESLPANFGGPRSSIPFLLKRRLFGEKIDWGYSTTTQIKNQIIQEVAMQLNMQFCDINQIMLERSCCTKPFPKYIHKDNIHFEDRAKKVIVKEYLNFIKD